jgi:hypothetical protein
MSADQASRRANLRLPLSLRVVPTSGFAEASDGIGGLCPELRFFYGAAGLTPCEPDSAPRNSTDGHYHLPFHALNLSDPSHSRRVR